MRGAISGPVRWDTARLCPGRLCPARLCPARLCPTWLGLARLAPCRCRWRGGSAEQPERAFLLEVHGHRGERPDPADPPTKLGDLCARSRVGQHPQAEGELGRADVIPLLDRQSQGNRVQVSRAELPVQARRAARPHAGQ